MLTSWIVSPVFSVAMLLAARPDGVPLVDLLQRASQVLDAPIFYEPREVADCAVDVGGALDAMAALPREQFLVEFEKELQEQHFVHLERTIGAVHSHTVMHLDPDRMKNLALKTVVRRVSWDEIAGMADRQALVITTCYCTTVPAEQVVATIEEHFDASKMEDIRHVEGTNAILMTAFAANLAQLLPALAQLGARPAEHEVAVLPREPTADQGEAPVVLRCEPRGLRLPQVVDAATRLTGEPFFYEPRSMFSAADRFEEERVVFAGEIRLDRGNVLAWLDAILQQTRISRQTRTVASQPIEVLWDYGRVSRRKEARSVPPDELTACDGEYVTTAVGLEHISASHIDTICCRFGGWDEDFVRSIQDTNVFVFTGAADKLAAYVALLREIDQNATIETTTPAKAPPNKPATK